MANAINFNDARRRALESAAKKAILDLFEHMGAASALLLPLDADEKLFVAAGDKPSIAALAAGGQNG